MSRPAGLSVRRDVLLQGDVGASIHLVLHALVPALIAGVFFRKRRLFAFSLMIAGMAIDVDHLLASPVYDPNRCSVGFHPLHALPLIPVYVALAVMPKTRLVGLGLSVHLALDALDCALMR